MLKLNQNLNWLCQHTKKIINILSVSSLIVSFVIIFLFLVLSCEDDDDQSGEDPNYYNDFASPEKVTITGYTGDVMEPFISRDGSYLFFNDAGGTTEKDLYYATFINETTFQFQGPLSSVNTTAVDGAPSLDVSGTLFWITTAYYNPPNLYDSIYTGIWDGNAVLDITPVSGLAVTEPGYINFDVEISRDGLTLYFAEGYFSGGNVPEKANIYYAKSTGGSFTRDPNSSSIMANVNTSDLEYAPAISSDGCELFFTRLERATLDTHILRTVRSDSSSPFEKPELVVAIEGFVEGPAYSPNEKSLYYHKKNTNTGLFELYRVTR